MRLDFPICVRLYGHSFDSVTSPLAFVALFLHVATVLNHILVMSFWTSWSSRARTSLRESHVSQPSSHLYLPQC